MRFTEQIDAAIKICGIHNPTCQAAIHAATRVIVEWVEGKISLSEVKDFLSSPGYTPTDAVNNALDVALDFVLGKGAIFYHHREQVDALLESLLPQDEEV